MGGNFRGQTSQESYSKSHVRAIINSLGLKVIQETWKHYLVYCVFHGNTDTPSLEIDKESGLFICFNPACGESGQLPDLVKHVKHFNDFEVLRFMINVKPNESEVFEDELSKILEVEDEFTVFDPNKIKVLADALEGSVGQEYMVGRGFHHNTLRHFGVGYSAKMGMVDVPVYSHNSIPVGLIGRSVEGKRFKNSVGLPSSKVFFNANRAMRTSSTAIIVEAAFDAMLIHQAGYPNVIATIGGHVSPYKRQLLNRYFDRIIIMTDNDKPQYNGVCRQCGGVCRGHNPGRELGISLAESFNREVEWAVWSDNEVYPHNAKDAGDLTEEEIQKLIKNAVPDVEYRLTHMV